MNIHKAIKPEEPQSIRAKKSHIRLLFRCFFNKFRKQRLPYISDHYARDIGLTPTEIELMRFKYPSETNSHPRL